MSTTSTSAASRSASSSLAASTKFKTFVMIFSISGPVVYCVIQYFNYPLFTFHPATNRVVWGYEAARSGEGPNMLWYGWTVTAILIAAALGIIAMMLPEQFTRKIPLSLVWILPVLAIPYIVYSLMPWWTLAFGLGH
ncbi:MAG TPA: hypothetical protein VH206_08925 [Xanthobacteraceae bacterium]|jgi:hypothetical protein|nr:hypothetical protein [Xanthobacteraceae bacterium]